MAFPGERRRQRLRSRPVTTCRFCLIVAGSEASRIVMNEPAVMAFLDRRPLFPGHVLVVPAEHVETLDELPDDLIGPLFGAVRTISIAVRDALAAEGTFVAMNNRVSQSVPHLHVHVVPRTKGDGLRGFFWPRKDYDDEAHADTVADAIRHAIG